MITRDGSQERRKEEEKEEGLPLLLSPPSMCICIHFSFPFPPSPISLFPLRSGGGCYIKDILLPLPPFPSLPPDSLVNLKNDLALLEGRKGE